MRTRAFCVSLGTSPTTGKDSLDLTKRFREQLLSLYPKPPSVSLLSVTDLETRTTGVTAVYDADNTAAAAWVERAKAVSGDLWQKVAERRTGVSRE